MNLAFFFDAIRPSFGKGLSGPQVAGMEALLTAGDGLPLQHMANILAQVRRETGGYMFPIKETVMPHHKDKAPSDKEVIRRLDAAFKAGKLPWVKTPYWRDGMFGRGQLQVTHRRNLQVVGKAIGFDLVGKPELLLDPHISALATIAGMKLGLFTGKKLGDYAFPGAITNAPDHNPRRIVNGKDGSDKEVADFHRQFVAALERAGWGKATIKQSLTVAAPQGEQPQPGFWAGVFQALAGIFKGKAE